MLKLLRRLLPVFVILIVGLIALYVVFGRPAPTPEAFENALPLAQAIERAAEINQPVLVLATADWCYPCQQLKRRALRDERVAQRIRESMVPVYFDATNPLDESTRATARELGVSGLPALIVLRGGAEVGRLEGDVPAIELLSWLEQF